MLKQNDKVKSHNFFPQFFKISNTMHCFRNLFRREHIFTKNYLSGTTADACYRYILRKKEKVHEEKEEKNQLSCQGEKILLWPGHHH